MRKRGVENSGKRPDVIVFLNGLPVVVFELKSPSREETDASEAYRQLRNPGLIKIVPKARVPNVGAVRETPKCRHKACLVSTARLFINYTPAEAPALPGHFTYLELLRRAPRFQGVDKYSRYISLH